MLLAVYNPMRSNAERGNEKKPNWFEYKISPLTT